MGSGSSWISNEFRNRPGNLVKHGAQDFAAGSPSDSKPAWRLHAMMAWLLKIDIVDFLPSFPLAASSMASRGGVMLCALLLLQLAGPLPSCNGSSSVYQPRLPLDMSHWDYVDKVPRFPHQPKIELPDRLWALHDLPRAVAHSNPSSLHAMLRKLSAGEPITVVALGSSVTSDFGGCFGREERIQDMVEIMSLVYPRHKCGWHGWIHCMMHIINATWPHEDHVLINNGLPGATGKTYGSGTCMELNLPDQADLIIMEHHAADEAATKLMEQLQLRNH
eukprot:gene17897-24289_t